MIKIYFKKNKNNISKKLQTILDYNFIFENNENNENNIGVVCTTKIKIFIPYYSLICIDNLITTKEYFDVEFKFIKKHFKKNLYETEINENLYVKSVYDTYFNNFTQKFVFENAIELDRTYINNPTEFFNDYFGDNKWFIDQNNYIKSLTIKKLLTIHGYTYKGDDIINNFTQKKKEWYEKLKQLLDDDTKLKTESNYYMPFAIQGIKYIRKNNLDLKIIKSESSSLFDKYHAFLKIMFKLDKKAWKKIIIIYVNDLNSIINKAPTINKKLMVFRGVSNDDYLKKLTDSKFLYKRYISTSLNPEISILTSGFMGKYDYKTDKRCCLQKIKLMSGVKCLFIMGVSKSPQEFEILLPPGTICHIDKNTEYGDFNMYRDKHLIHNKSVKTFIKTTEMTIQKDNF